MVVLIYLNFFRFMHDTAQPNPYKNANPFWFCALLVIFTGGIIILDRFYYNNNIDSLEETNVLITEKVFNIESELQEIRILLQELNEKINVGKE